MIRRVGRNLKSQKKAASQVGGSIVRAPESHPTRFFSHHALLFATVERAFLENNFPYFSSSFLFHFIFAFAFVKVDDAEEFRALAAALTTLGVTDEEQEGLWRLLSALLHIGNIQFVEGEEDGARESGGGGGGLRLESPLVEVESVAKMAGLPATRLVSSMRKKVQWF